jgi:hypothetical protein
VSAASSSGSEVARMTESNRWYLTADLSVVGHGNKQEVDTCDQVACRNAGSYGGGCGRLLLLVSLEQAGKTKVGGSWWG